MAQIYKQVYTSFIVKLVTNLPMDDKSFIDKLSDEHLLPGNTQEEIESLPTQAEKSLYFLSHVIEPSLGITGNYFDTFLGIMESHKDTDVRKLAATIKDEIAS